MKKLLLTPPFLLIACCSFAQNGISYTAFIQQDTAIKWAAECNKLVDLTPKVSDYSIKQFYLTKLKNGKAVFYKLNDDKHSVSTAPAGTMNLERPDWLRGLECKYLPLEYAWVFTDKNDPEKGYRLNSVSNDPCCGCDEANAARVKQLLYFKKNRFYIQNVFLSPLCARKDAGDKAAWYPLCNVAFNPLPDNNRPIPLSKDMVLINSENIVYHLKSYNNATEDSLLTVGSEPIFHQLFDNIYSGKIKAYDTRTGKLIPGKKFSSWGMQKFLVQDYDSSGEVKGTREVLYERNPDSLSQIRIRQDLYFDFKNEKLYSRIKWIELVEDVYTSQGIMLGSAAFCRIRY